MPVDHGIARSVEYREGDPTNAAATDLIVTDYADGFHDEQSAAIDPQERQRRLRIRRLRDYVRNVTPTATETVAALKDVIREIGRED